MMDFREMVLHESAHSGLVFREDGYGKGHNHELIRDLISLANAAVTGPRFIVLGADASQSGRRRIRGVPRETIEALQKLLPRAAARVIEPALKVTLRQSVIADRIIGIVIIDECDERPYLLARDLSRSLHAGRGWIRRGTVAHALLRADLERMFAGRTSGALPARGSAPAAQPKPKPKPKPRPKPEPEHGAALDASVAIGFPGERLAAEISLPVLPLDALPSRLAAERLQKLLKGKESARDVLGRTETQISRLLHVQLFGAEKSYEKHSDATLMQQLLHVEEANEAEDRHYQFEQRAHKLQLEICNNLEFEIDPVTVVLTIAHTDGVGVSERIYPEPGVKSDPAPGYPIVETSNGRLVVQTTTSRLRPGSRRPVFRQPVRIWLREPAAGKTLVVDYTLQCRDLSAPISGALRVRVEAARRPAAAEVRRPTGTG